MCVMRDATSVPSAVHYYEANSLNRRRKTTEKIINLQCYYSKDNNALIIDITKHKANAKQ